MTNEEKAALERDVRELWVQTDPIVSVAQMARLFGVGETTLHAWIKRWGMPSRPKHPCDATNKRDPSRPRRKSRARVRLPEGHPLYPLSFAAAQARMTGPAAAVEPVRAAVPAVAPAPVNVATANGSGAMSRLGGRMPKLPVAPKPRALPKPKTLPNRASRTPKPEPINGEDSLLAENGQLRDKLHTLPPLPSLLMKLPW
jgi:hypothetical protein